MPVDEEGNEVDIHGIKVKDVFLWSVFVRTYLMDHPEPEEIARLFEVYPGLRSNLLLLWGTCEKILRAAGYVPLE